MTSEPELHFYPGPKRLMYFVDGSRKITVEAWGGPEDEQPLREGEKFPPGPTDTGRFVIYGRVRYRTDTWAGSKIPWGARLKMNPKDFNDLLYEDGSGHWHSVRQQTKTKGSRGWSRAAVQAYYYQLYGDELPPKYWLFNDFGPIAIRYFKDKNHNRKLDAGERLEGEMFHTEPRNEALLARFNAHPHPPGAEPPAVMTESHGCIHLKPFDRDKLIGLNAFAPGTTLVIHRYDEVLPP